ncbi:MAG: hypothetical protein WCT49_06180 [Candidatus Paceibacterota bacterium]|jgi:hypothetical protein|nr:hypothetical protein [Candidatus Paceibacterota bacterium]
MQNKIFIFGNPDLEIDSLPLRILPSLRSCFPDIEFTVLDPNEEWKIPDEMVMIDTVVGIKELTVFNDLKHFIEAPRVSVHDFDAFFNLIYLQKLGKLKKIKIFGIPPEMEENAAAEILTKAIKSYIISI